MGAAFEKNEDFENKISTATVSNRDRVFVCMGTVGKNKPYNHFNFLFLIFFMFYKIYHV
jgi:hypothetical protein